MDEFPEDFRCFSSPIGTIFTIFGGPLYPQRVTSASPQIRPGFCLVGIGHSQGADAVKPRRNGVELVQALPSKSHGIQNEKKKRPMKKWSVVIDRYSTNT